MEGVLPVAKGHCPVCGYTNGEHDLYCVKCMRPLRWPVKPQSSKKNTLVAREGTDTFIRGPNDALPKHKVRANAGGDLIGPIGSWYSPTGLRYLIKFDIPAAFKTARVSMEDFDLEEAILILRLFPARDAEDDVPIAVFPLSRPFVEGEGRWGEHRRKEPGCNWYNYARGFPWANPGGDYFYSPVAKAVLPRKGSGEVEIDVTEIFAEKFFFYQRTGVWTDYGMIIMRDQEKSSRCLFRMIYSFQSAPERDIAKTGSPWSSPSWWQRPKSSSTGSESSVLSPELILR